jgi:hypothetical protein
VDVCARLRGNREFQTPYVDWTLSISTLHSLMHWNTPTFLAKIGECFPQGLGTSISQLIHARSMPTLAFITHLTLSARGWNKQLLLKSQRPLPPPPVLNPPLVWVKTLRGYSQLTTATIAPCSRGREPGQRRRMPRREHPTDPDGYCTFHRRTGHTTEQCRARLQPPTTDIQCCNCNKFGHKSPHCPKRNRSAHSF